MEQVLEVRRAIITSTHIVLIEEKRMGYSKLYLAQSETEFIKIARVVILQQQFLEPLATMRNVLRRN